MNDLIGLEYQWGAHFRDGRGKTDCFQLVCEIRERLGLSDYSEKFCWAYWLYSPETLKPTHVARWLLQNGKRLKIPEHGAVALIADLYCTSSLFLATYLLQSLPDPSDFVSNLE